MLIRLKGQKTKQKKTPIFQVGENLNLAQLITKLFQYGKEYVRAFGQSKQPCISLTNYFF